MPDHPPARQDAAALAALIPQLRAYARGLARDSGIADDLVQDTLLRALQALPALRAETDLRSWSFTVLRNLFFQRIRRTRIEQRVLAQAAAEESVDAPQAGVAEMRRLQALLGRLSPLLREALILVGANGMSYEEAAMICGVPPGTMKARVSRARAQLARLTGPLTDT
jgi:RNA polymerase sigma-70 factor (ECF subfamily)